jgi:hypothetical protein
VIVLHVLAVIIGVIAVLAVLRSAIRTVVVPRGEQAALTRTVFLGMRAVYHGLSRRHTDRPERQAAVYARFAPVSLVVLAATWVTLVLLAFVPIHWGATNLGWADAFLLSGSSITTLGFFRSQATDDSVLAFVEAFIGLGLLALLISYLPTIYGHFSRREAEVVKLEVRAGSPPSPAEFLLRFHRIAWLDRLSDTWADWEQWFTEVEESHTSQPSLVMFRSQRRDNSWITAAGTVLDTAALSLSTLERPWDPQAALMIRSGFLALRSIATYFNVPFDPVPSPNDPISVTRTEYDALYDRLAAEGVRLVPDREQAWRDFAGWRVNYDVPLLALCALASAPPAVWSGDRAHRFHPPVVRRPRTWRIDPSPNPASW